MKRLYIRIDFPGTKLIHEEAPRSFSREFADANIFFILDNKRNKILEGATSALCVLSEQGSAILSGGR